MEKISVVIPCYNEEDVLRLTYNKMKEVMQDKDYELIFVNDGSKDKTLDILKEIAQEDNKVKIVGFARNFGHQIAITAGLDYATGEYIAFIDADLQDPPELILDMVKKMKNEGYNVVYGTRTKRNKETIFKKLTAKAYYRILNKLSEIKMPVDTGDFRVIDKKVADVLRNMPEKNRYIRGMVTWIGFKQTAINYERNARAAGKTKYTLKKMLKLSADGIFSFSLKPLKLATTSIYFSGILAIVIFILSLFFSENIILKAIINILPLLIGIMVFGILAIFAEYIGRIYKESLHRPLYIVAELINIETNN